MKIPLHSFPALHLFQCKFFIYVTKTCLNLSTHSRKPEDYNGPIIFEIEKVLPNQFKILIFATVITKMSLFSGAIGCCLSNFLKVLKKSSLTDISIDWGGFFHNINLKNNSAIVIPWFSTVCG